MKKPAALEKMHYVRKKNSKNLNWFIKISEQWEQAAVHEMKIVQEWVRISIKKQNKNPIMTVHILVLSCLNKLAVARWVNDIAKI